MAAHPLSGSYASHTFGLQRSVDLLSTIILKTGPDTFDRVRHVLHSGCLELPPDAVYKGSPGYTLDFEVDHGRGPVVPQEMWAPQSARRCKQHVDDGELTLPIFFVDVVAWSVGVSISGVMAGSYPNLYGLDNQVNFGKRSTITLRLQVRSFPTCLASLMKYRITSITPSSVARIPKNQKPDPAPSQPGQQNLYLC